MIEVDVSPERIANLRDALARLDPYGLKTWRLEVFNPGGRLVKIIDIRTGKTIKDPDARKKINQS